MKIVALVLPLLTGCGTFMTESEVAVHGTRAFAAPFDKTFAATEGALAAQGYTIVADSPERGTIVTERKVIAHGGGIFEDLTRQYELTVRPSRAGDATVVVAHPHKFIGDADYTQRRSWILNGVDGERARWASLFRQIAELL